MKKKQDKNLFRLKQQILTLLDHSSIIETAQSYLASRSKNNISAGFLAYLVQGHSDVDLNSRYRPLSQDKQIQARLKAIHQKAKASSASEVSANSAPGPAEVESTLIYRPPVVEDFSEIEEVEPGGPQNAEPPSSSIERDVPVDHSFETKVCDYFDIQGPFTLSSLKKAYKKMVVIYHPDKAADSNQAHVMFIEMSELFELAKDYFEISNRITQHLENISSAIEEINSSSQNSVAYQQAIENGIDNAGSLVKAITVARVYGFLSGQRLAEKTQEVIEALVCLFTALCGFHKKGPWALVTNNELNVCFDKIIQGLSALSSDIVLTKPTDSSNRSSSFSSKLQSFFEKATEAGKKVASIANQVLKSISSVVSYIWKGCKLFAQALKDSVTPASKAEISQSMDIVKVPMQPCVANRQPSLSATNSLGKVGKNTSNNAVVQLSKRSSRY